MFAEKAEQDRAARGADRLVYSSSRIINLLFTGASEILPVFLCSSTITGSTVEKNLMLAVEFDA